MVAPRVVKHPVGDGEQVKIVAIDPDFTINNAALARRLKIAWEGKSVRRNGRHTEQGHGR